MVDAAAAVCANTRVSLADVEAAVDVADEIRPVDIGRRRRHNAIDRRKGVGVAGERAPEIGNQRVALPVGDGEKFRRDQIERRALLGTRSARIGVVAAAEFERGLDQKAAGVIADRAERIVIDLQPFARRLADHRAGHRGRDRRLVGGLGRRDRQAAPPRSKSPAPGCRDPAAVSASPGPDRISASCGCD